MNSGRFAEIEAVVFDAVGTLLEPAPAAAEVYAAVGRRHGSLHSAEEIAPRFAAAFRREEERDHRAGLATSEEREVERWRTIVESVLDDVDDAPACFRELYEHFARPDAWHCAVETAPVLGQLHERGYLLGLASNYDSRLRRVLAGCPALQTIGPLIISSEVGWRKPARSFFDALVGNVGRPADRILFVGDDPVNDYEGARAAGLPVLLFDPHHRGAAESFQRIGRLAELLDVLPGA